MKNAAMTPLQTYPGTKIPLHQELMELYWEKKELDNYLPGLSKHSTPEELCLITLAQLSSMEKRIVTLLHEISKSENTIG